MSDQERLRAMDPAQLDEMRQRADTMIRAAPGWGAMKEFTSEEMADVLSLVARQAQEIEHLRQSLMGLHHWRECCENVSTGPHNHPLRCERCRAEDAEAEVARQAQEIQDLRSQSVMALARHYGCGEHVSFSDAWRWLAERVEMVRVGQAELETFKSSAETALGAFVDRIKALRSEIQDLRTELEHSKAWRSKAYNELAESRDALRDACRVSYAVGNIPAEPFVRAGNVLAETETPTEDR